MDKEKEWLRYMSENGTCIEARMALSLLNYLDNIETQYEEFAELIVEHNLLDELQKKGA